MVPPNLISRPPAKYQLFNSTKSNKLYSQYDFVVIGSGIGGLVTANYLIREGFKVLMVEQHYLVGGCCTTYIKDGYFVNPAVHFINGVHEGGNFHQVFKELEIPIFDSLIQFQENDLVVVDNQIFPISPNMKITIDRFKKEFPAEADATDRFFKYYYSQQFSLDSVKGRFGSFEELLLSFFSAHSMIVRIFKALGILYLSVPMNQVNPLAFKSTFDSIVFNSRFVPKTGHLQDVSDRLMQTFLDRGGHLLIRKSVQKIDISNGVYEIHMPEHEKIAAMHIVSNISPHEFIRLLPEPHQKSMNKKVTQTTSSKSLIAGFYAVDAKNEFVIPSEYSGSASNYIVEFNAFDVEKYPHMIKDNAMFISNHRFSHGRSNDVVITYLVVDTPEIQYWKEGDQKRRYFELGDSFLRKHFQYADSLKVIDTASPHSVFHFTKNTGGAVYGLNPGIGLNERKNIIAPYNPELANVFFAGHWIFPGGGTERVASSARALSKKIMQSKTVESIKMNRVGI